MKLLTILTNLFKPKSRTHDKTVGNSRNEGRNVSRLRKLETCANDYPYNEWHYAPTEDDGKE